MSFCRKFVICIPSAATLATVDLVLAHINTRHLQECGPHLRETLLAKPWGTLARHAVVQVLGPVRAESDSSRGVDSPTVGEEPQMRPGEWVLNHK